MARQEIMTNSGHHRMKAGDAIIVAKAVIRAAAWLGLSSQELGAILGIVDDSDYAAVMESNEVASEHALLLIHLHSLLTDIVGGDADAAASWLRSYNIALETYPLELLQSGPGLRRVVEYLVSRSSL